MRQKLPLVLSLTALAVAVFGATPLGQAAGGVVRRALFANNAGKVNGIRASRRPQANQLLALGPDAKFPSSAIPSSPQGPLNSVGGDQVVDSSLTGADVEDGSLTGDDVEDGSLTGAKLADRTVTARQIDLSTLPRASSESVALDGRLDAGGTARQSWDVGPHVTLIAQCSQTAGGFQFDQLLLNNAPQDGEVNVTDLVSKTTVGAPTPFVSGTPIASGATGLLTRQVSPASGALGVSSFATIIWRDGSGEVVSGSYRAVVTAAGFCRIEGMLTRAAT